ncbi:unnamed protein product [Rotaria sp. Silwood1]|nr:unnamed protein product [Rotaria sp. Silwood1]CAF1651033.1 unnamed protein product [Rotaria sp. Silwood1]CAF3840755.1 unnamed protein product [Rotaria sp. Silwood1]CAF3925225.1 unnamed protein product [Rotaria sp. Silwood1]CAF4794815.1 unnamed protein product [Rotaria sp. Silwood1]
MGNSQHNINRKTEEQNILQNPHEGEASQFYWACRNGDVEHVKELLNTIPYQDLNRLEPNGSTPLHAASYNGHSIIVGLLLRERGCQRDRVNRHGLTAYEEAQTEEIRQLFYRPSERNRFCEEDDDDSNDSIGNRFTVNVKKEEKEDDGKPDDFAYDQWLVGYETSEEIEWVKADFAAGKAICQKFIPYLSDKQCGSLTHILQQNFSEELDKLICEHIPKTHREFEKCKMLIQKAFDKQQLQPEYLLRLYTLETPVYGALSKDAGPLFHPLLFALNQLKPRHFQGTSYRGVKMVEEDLHAYRWAMKSRGAIETRTFCSTSLDRSVAARFAGINRPINNERRSVLMAFNFPQPCDTAFNLGKISAELSCVSEYENEAEVLMLPSTLFIVRQIETAANYVTIQLENIETKPKSRSAYFKAFFKNMKRNASITIGSKTYYAKEHPSLLR